MFWNNKIHVILIEIESLFQIYSQKIVKFCIIFEQIFLYGNNCYYNLNIIRSMQVECSLYKKRVVRVHNDYM